MPSQQSPLPILFRAASPPKMSFHILDASQLQPSHYSINSAPPAPSKLEGAGLGPSTPSIPSNHLQSPRNVDSHCTPLLRIPPKYISSPRFRRRITPVANHRKNDSIASTVSLKNRKQYLNPEMKLGCLPGLRQLFLLSSSRSRRQRLCEGRRDRVVNLHSQ